MAETMEMSEAASSAPPEWPFRTEVGGYAIRARLEPHCLEFEMRSPEHDAPADLRGRLKWDGCCDWMTGPHYEHICGVNDLDRLKEAFVAVYALAEQHLDNFEG